MRVVCSIAEEIEVGEKGNLKEEIARLNSEGITIATLEEKLENAQKSIDKLMLSLRNQEGAPEAKLQEVKKAKLSFPLRNSTNRSHIVRSPYSPLSFSWKVIMSEQENRSPQNKELECGVNTSPEPCKATPNRENHEGISSRESTPGQRRPNSVNVKKVQEMFKNAVEENIRSIRAYVTQMIEVGQMYMDVELRRLTWLEQQLVEVGNISPALLGDEPAGSVSSSIRDLKQEREHPAKRLTSRVTAAKELEMLYLKWDVPPGGKERRLQLVNKLWTDPHNIQHIQESAEARLAGLYMQPKNNTEIPEMLLSIRRRIQIGISEIPFRKN